MKKQLTRWMAALILALPAAALADSSVDSTSLLRIYQDTRTGFDTKTFAPLTQFLGVDADRLGDGNLSLHLFGWGRADFADRYVTPGQSETSLNGALTYGYLQYRFGAANARARAGRFFIHEGVVNEELDGVSAHTDLPYGFGVSAFAGATVHTTSIPGANNDGKGDGIFGGRLNYRYGGLLELGISGVYETAAPAASFDPVLSDPAHPRLGDHRLVGADLYLSPLAALQLIGHASYNTETRSVAEEGYLLQVKPLKGVLLAAEFNQYRDRAYFYASPLFAGLPSMLDGSNLNRMSRSYGGSASYALGEKAELVADLKHYSREIGHADRFGGEVRVTLPDGALRAGAGYHYLNASPQFAVVPATTTSGSFHEVRLYALRDTKGYFGSLDLIDYLFERDISGKKSAWQMLGSLGWHLTPSLALSGDLSYGSNPQYADDVRGLVRLTYAGKFAGKGDYR